MTPEQQRALAIARAKRARAQSSGQPANDDTLSMVRTASGGFLEGIPVVGPMIRGTVDRAAAATLAPFSDQTYGEILQTIQRGTEDEKKANPWLDTGSQIAGAVGGTIPMVMAAPAAFGAGAGGLGARTVASGLTGTALGGADSVIRSEGDGRQTIKGALIGGGTGLLGPAIGAGIGKGWQGFRNMRANRTAALAEGMDPASLSKLNRAITSDGIDPSQIGPRMDALGPQGMIMDLGPNLQRQAGALAANPGRAQEIIRSGVAARDAGANARIAGAIDDTLGPAPMPTMVDEAISANQGNVSPAYAEVFRGARRVDTEPIAQSLESSMVNLRGPAQKAAREVRQMLNVAGTDALDPNPQTLFQTRQAIDGLMASNTDTNAARVLMGARQQVDDMLARSVPGIKEVDAQFSELARQRDAFGRGQQALDSGKTAPRPQELAREFEQGALPQGQQIGPSAVPVRLREGARAEIDRIIGTNANDRVALQRIIKGEGDWNRDRLVTLFGKEKTDKILGVLSRERVFADTSNVVTRNSETAARQAAMKEVSGEAPPQFGMREGYMAGGIMGTLRSGGVKVAEQIAKALMGASREASNSGLAKALTDQNYESVVRALMKSQSGEPVNREAIETIARALLTGGGQSAVRP